MSYIAGLLQLLEPDRISQKLEKLSGLALGDIFIECDDLWD